MKVRVSAKHWDWNRIQPNYNTTGNPVMVFWLGTRRPSRWQRVLAFLRGLAGEGEGRG